MSFLFFFFLVKPYASPICVYNLLQIDQSLKDMHMFLEEFGFTVTPLGFVNGLLAGHHARGTVLNEASSV
jgi:hypothetical protein